MVGNKSDLDAKRAVTKEEAEKLAKDNSINYLEISAKTGENVPQLFDQIGQQVLNENPNLDKPKQNEGIHLETPLEFAPGTEQKQEGRVVQSKRGFTCCK